MRPLPHAEGDQLIYLRQSAELAGVDNILFSVPEILDLRNASETLTGFAEYSALTFNMLDQGEPAQVRAGISLLDLSPYGKGHPQPASRHQHGQ